MNIADLKEKSLSIFFVISNLSLIYNKIAKIKVVQAINSKFLIFSIKPDFTRIKPTIITGRDEIRIFKKRTLFK